MSVYDLGVLASCVGGCDVVLFDFDGTLAFTERMHIAAFDEVLGKHGAAGSISDEWWSQNGYTRAASDIVRAVMRDFGFDGVPFDAVYADYMRESRRMYVECGLSPYSYVEPTLAMLGEAGKRIGIWSNSSRGHVWHWLLKWGLAGRFDSSLCLTFQDTGMSKEDMLAGALGEADCGVCVFDDGREYLRSAKGMGCVTIGVDHCFSNIVDGDGNDAIVVVRDEVGC